MEAEETEKVEYPFLGKLSDLRDCIERDWKNMDVVRQRATDNWRMVAGHNFGKNGEPERVPVNHALKLFLVLSRHLVAKNPDPDTNTDLTALKATAEKLRYALRIVGEDIHVGKFMRRMAEIAAVEGTSVKYTATTLPFGAKRQKRWVGDTPHLTALSLSNWCVDGLAEDWADITYMCHWYTVPAATLLKSDDLTKEQKREISGSVDDCSRVDNEDGTERPSAISNNNETGNVQYVPHVWLCHVYHPLNDMISVHLAPTGPGTISEKPLFFGDYDGPQNGPYSVGPYTVLRYIILEGNLLGMSLLAPITDLTIAANDLLSKSLESELNRKDLVLGRYSSDEDMEKIVNAPHMGMVSIKTESGDFKQVTFGGQTETAQVLGITMANGINYMTNLEALSASGPAADTLGQEDMLRSAAAAEISDMTFATYELGDAVMQDLKYYICTDPAFSMKIGFDVFGEKFQTELTAKELEGKFADINVSVKMDSMRRRSREQRAKDMEYMATNLILPMQPIWSQQNKVFDAVGFLTKYAALRGEESELQAMFTGDDPLYDEQPRVPAEQASRFSSPPPREQIRRSVPVQTTRGANANLQALLMGGAKKMQGGQIAAVGS